MNTYKPKDDTIENNTNMLQSVIIKLHAHKNYIVPRIKDEERKLQAKVTFDSIIEYITASNKPISPQEIKKYQYLISDNKTHENVLDTYEDIYYNMFKRFYGRSEDFYLEKV
jgi:hypothetical protein